MNSPRSLSLAALAFAALLPTAIPATAHADGSFAIVERGDQGAVTLTDPPQRTAPRQHEASCGEGTCSAGGERRAPRQSPEASCSAHAAPAPAPAQRAPTVAPAPAPAQRRAPTAAQRRAPRQHEASCGEGTCSARR
jgi:uncharacterized low-complexity protein